MSEAATLVIVGAGPVGATLALLLADSPHTLRVLEARHSAPTSTRTLAISFGGKRILERSGVWRYLDDAPAITEVHVSEAGQFGRTRILASDIDVPALGYVVPYPQLQTALDHALDERGVDVRRGARVTSLADGHDTVTVTFEDDGVTHALAADAVAIADGGAILPALEGVTLEEKDYGQVALVARIASDVSPRGVAYERFTAEGPIALLPHNDEYTLIWVAAQSSTDARAALDDAALLAAVQTAFGERAGRFTRVGERTTYPLKLRRATLAEHARTVLVGNAAQAMHPVAGQGFNLGLRDAWDLAQTLHDASDEQVPRALARYCNERGRDSRMTVGFTDFLATAFVRDLGPLNPLRGVALAALDVMPGVRRELTRRLVFGS